MSVQEQAELPIFVLNLRFETKRILIHLGATVLTRKQAVSLRPDATVPPVAPDGRAISHDATVPSCVSVQRVPERGRRGLSYLNVCRTTSHGTSADTEA